MSELLKWQFHPDKRSPRQTFWGLSHFEKSLIKQERITLMELLEKNPSLRNYLVEKIDSAYEIAILKVLQVIEIEESIFPPTCPYTFEEILDQEFYPNGN